jgi:hypothetical protein
LSKWAAIAAELRTKPGRWAHVDTRPNLHSAASTAWNINRGSVASMPLGEFESTSRTVDGQARVYARFIGGETS